MLHGTQTLTQESFELLESFSVLAYQVETGYRYQVEALFVSGETDNWTAWKVYPTFESAIESGIESFYRQCAISQLYDTLYDWVDSGLIDDVEFEAVEASLHGQTDQRNTIEV